MSVAHHRHEQLNEDDDYDYLRRREDSIRRGKGNSSRRSSITTSPSMMQKEIKKMKSSSSPSRPSLVATTTSSAKARGSSNSPLGWNTVRQQILKPQEQIHQPYERRQDDTADSNASNFTNSTVTTNSASTTSSSFERRHRRFLMQQQQRRNISRDPTVRQQQQQQQNITTRKTPRSSVAGRISALPPAEEHHCSSSRRGENSTLDNNNKKNCVTPSPPRTSPRPRNASSNDRITATAYNRVSDMRNFARKSRLVACLQQQPNNHHATVTTGGAPLSSRAVSMMLHQQQQERTATNPGTPPLAPRNTSIRWVTPTSAKTHQQRQQSNTNISRNRLDGQTTATYSTQGMASNRNVKAEKGKLLKQDATNTLSSSTAVVTPIQQNAGYEEEEDTTALKVYVRKRPIFARQVQSGDYDVVRVVDNTNGQQEGGNVVVYRTTLSDDCTAKMVQPVVFAGHLAGAFDQDVTSEHVYQTAVRPLVLNVVLRQEAATLLLFGQSQSGKTYTLQACQKFVSAELFKLKQQQQVRVQCLEVGKRCRDLMGADGANENVKIVDKDDGSGGSPSVTLVNAMTTVVDSPRELLSILVRTQKRRDKVSRSHAIYQMRTAEGGVLTLVDCASMERRNDEPENAAINASLYSLRECIRVRGLRNQKTRVPYRSCNLTRVIRESLEGPKAKLAVIATIAPNAAATEQTIQTLKTLAHLAGAAWQERNSHNVVDASTTKNPGEDVYEAPSTPPKRWNHDELIEWLKDRRLLGSSPVPKRVDGHSIMRMSRIQLRNTFYDSDEDKSWAVEKADLLFKSLRVESDRIARIELRRRLAEVAAMSAD